jgi:hypothetical protein
MIEEKNDSSAWEWNQWNTPMRKLLLYDQALTSVGFLTGA